MQSVGFPSNSYPKLRNPQSSPGLFTLTQKSPTGPHRRSDVGPLMQTVRTPRIPARCIMPVLTLTTTWAVCSREIKGPRPRGSKKHCASGPVAEMAAARLLLRSRSDGPPVIRKRRSGPANEWARSIQFCSGHSRRWLLAPAGHG